MAVPGSGSYFTWSSTRRVGSRYASRRGVALVMCLLCAVLFPSTASGQDSPVGSNFTQVGSAITNFSTRDNQGSSSALSADGSFVIVGARSASTVNGFSGKATVYSRVDDSFVRVGQEILGAPGTGAAGSSVDINADGYRVAVGAEYHDDGGHVRVFDLVAGTWVQVGSDIVGAEEFAGVGRAISLSDDGSRLAVGTTVSTANGIFTGQTTIYKWSGTAWDVLGTPIDGEAAEDYSGWVVALSGDGRRVSMGASFNDGAAGFESDAGHARVFEFTGTDWVQLGSDIDGRQRFEGMGGAVALDRDGSTLAVASRPFDPGVRAGAIQVFQWSGTTWSQMGETLDGEDSNTLAGQALALNADGTRFAYGAEQHGPPGKSEIRGQVEVWDWNGTAWTQVGSDIEGARSSFTGASVDLNADGGVLVVGAPAGGFDANPFAEARVYEDTGSCGGQPITIDLRFSGGLTGTAGDDVVLGTDGPDLIDTGAGDDIVCGGDGDDEILGGDGRDKLYGQGGRDLIRGGPGNDRVEGGADADRLLGGTGNDRIEGGAGDDYIGGFGGDDTILGGDGSDVIFGGFGADGIGGGPGADVIHGLIGDDLIEGGPGPDIIDGDRGNDVIVGGSGDDVLRGGNANDVVHGDEGDDHLSGGKGDDRLAGGLGFDVCVGNKHTTADFAGSTCNSTFGVP